jgi:outer membrane protein assembly factor BamB
MVRLKDKKLAKLHVPAWGSPVVADGVVYFGIGNGRVNDPSRLFEPVGGVLAVEAATGKEVWPAFRVGDGVLKRVAVDDDALYFGSRDGYCYCVVRKTGKLHWRSALGSAVVATPVLARAPMDGRTLGVFVLASEGRVAFLDPRTGKADWTFPDLEKSGALLVSTPVVVTTPMKDGVQRRLYFGACLNGLSTPALYALQDIQSW